MHSSLDIPVIRLHRALRSLNLYDHSHVPKVQLMGSQYYHLASSTSDVDMAVAVPPEVVAQERAGAWIEIG